MADRSRGFSWGSALLGAVAVLLVLVIGALVVVRGGYYEIAASDGHGIFGPLFEATMTNAVKRKASGIEPPKVTQAQVIEGGGHYKAMCQRCHGGPGAEREQFATALTPRPPEMSHAAEEWSQSEIFWIAKHGIQMTAMPAFGSYESDEELWKIAAFVEQLPEISPAQYAAIPEAHGHGSSGTQQSGGQQSSGHPHPGGGH